MKVGDLVKMKRRFFSTGGERGKQVWLVTSITKRGTDDRGELILCKIYPTFTDKVDAIWKWSYELREVQ